MELSAGREIVNSEVVHGPLKMGYFADFFARIYDCKHLYLCIFLYDIPSFCHHSGHTSDPKMHHPAMDSQVLQLQCDKATAVFVPSKDCDIVSEVSKCGSRGLDLIFSVLYLNHHFTAVRVRVVVFFFVFSGSCSKKQVYGSV